MRRVHELHKEGGPLVDGYGGCSHGLLPPRRAGWQQCWYIRLPSGNPLWVNSVHVAQNVQV